MTITDKRTRLDPDRLNKLIFLRKNRHSLNKLDEENGENSIRHMSLIAKMKVNKSHLRYRRNLELKIMILKQTNRDSNND